jgi:hypothetical protein
MTLSTPLGCISKAEERLRNMLAACQPMQAWLGVNTAAEAKDKIYLVELPPPMIDDEERDGTFSLNELTDRRPFAIVWTPSDRPFSIEMIASPGTPNPTGVLRVRLEENVPTHLGTNYAEAYRVFLNTVGQIIHSEEPHKPGLVELIRSNHSESLVIRRIDVLDHMRTTSDDVPTMGDAHKCELEITWGADT